MINELKEILIESLKKLYEKDESLISRHAHERSITFRFGIYFEELVKNSNFSHLNVDAEYNRNGEKYKFMPSELKRSKTYPDILLHQRETNNQNRLLLEFKTYWNNNSKACEIDIKKLKYFTSQDEEYKYTLGAFIELERYTANVIYFINGTQIESVEIPLLKDKLAN
ncbi:MAG: hypothetical protein WCK96_02610 [Methylococcales bacterium]